ncbi:glycosyltransferase family 2 protein [Flavobacterium piscinae]|uniref:glycosyltransferase family 2 protein n=1 Tax=Flavobacterium piscinae TaxID=2506424 RepID=UPI001FE8EBE3|nr:glycosyltransferase family A protein [Flavobacterium piscinae]
MKSTKDFGYFPTEKQLIDSGYIIQKDIRFKSDESMKRELAWTAFQSGFINKNFDSGLNVWEKKLLPLEDEYLFLKKNFHKVWSIYVLIIRIITFNNPVKEILAFFKHKNISRQDYSKQIYQYQDYEGFKSNLIDTNPQVSIIIPTLNRYQYLKNVLRDLENQTYKNFELIVVDQTDDFKEEFYQNWNLDLKYWFQEEKALWKARNEAIKTAKGELILLYDDDSLIESNWIEEHLKCLDYFKADLSSGVSISVVGAEVPKNYSYFKWSDQLDTGNVLIKKEIFYKIGFFDLQFEKQRMGDGEFGLRCYLNGYKNISNYKAKRIHLKVSEGGLRQMGSWDGWRPKKMFGPRPVPSVLYYTRKYYKTNASIYMLLINIIPSYIPYKFKKSRVLKSLSFLMIAFLLPLITFQIFKSWQMSSKKLKEKSKISRS